LGAGDSISKCRCNRSQTLLIKQRTPHCRTAYLKTRRTRLPSDRPVARW
jgi:hypothetical protein